MNYFFRFRYELGWKDVTMTKAGAKVVPFLSKTKLAHQNNFIFWKKNEILFFWGFLMAIWAVFVG